jgi:AraC-like DNA-binding protein
MNPTVRTIADFLNADLHRLIRMAEMTASVDFRLPVQCLKELRLEKSRLLLETTTMRIKQVRLAVSYGDHSRFFRDFQEQLGLTRSEYRAQCLTKSSPESEPIK